MDVVNHKKKLLLVGSKGMLAQKIAARAAGEWEIIAVDLPDFDLTDQAQVLATVQRLSPAVIINCAAFTNVDACESEEEVATRVNGSAVGTLAEAAHAASATLVHISTDYVFSGTGNTPLSEKDIVGPQSAYGRSKLLGEQSILTSRLEKFIILRTSWLYGPGGNNFVETIIRLAKQREKLGIVADQIGSPTYTGDLADAIFSILASDVDPYGIYHFSNDGACSWYDFALKIVDLARKNGENLKIKEIAPIRTEDYPLPAKRPAYSVFSKEKYCQLTGKSIPFWQDSLAKYFIER